MSHIAQFLLSAFVKFNNLGCTMKFEEMNIKQKRVMIYFIEAAKELLKTEGVTALTIRKVATAAGYNSATLYNYFEDLDHLMLFASVSYLRDYANELYQRITPEMSALDRYRTIYMVFNRRSFQDPTIYYNLFFGKASRKLPEVIREYYVLFPEELEGHAPAVRQMLTEGNMYLRDVGIVGELVEEGTIRPENARMLASIVPRLQQTYLHEIYMYGDGIDPAQHHEKFMAKLEYLIDTAK